jgi:hypothetical protein
MVKIMNKVDYKNNLTWVPVALSCNPSYSEGILVRSQSGQISHKSYLTPEKPLCIYITQEKMVEKYPLVHGLMVNKSICQTSEFIDYFYLQWIIIKDQLGKQICRPF